MALCLLGKMNEKEGTVIYFDNAATTMQKPPEVAEAVLRAMTSFGGVGRGVHPASLAAGRAVFDARTEIARLLGAPSPSCVSFTLNATMALNIALQGLAEPGSTLVTTAASHNSVLRPLFKLRDERGCTVRIAPINPDAGLDFAAYERLLAEGSVHYVVATHASNLTGDVYDVTRMATLAHEHGALFILDAAQTAGAIPLFQQEVGADVVCFTGHKGLFGPQGTGGLCVLPSVDVPPLVEGGSGTYTFNERHPRFMPEALEAGTVNAHGLAGLAAGAGFVGKLGAGAIHEKVKRLTLAFEKGVRAMPGVRVLGGNGGIDRCGVVAIDAEGVDSALLGDSLAREHGICTRAGAQCAPLMHRALGTEETGAVRFSFSYFNTEEEIEQGLCALRKSVESLRKQEVSRH